MFRRKRSSSHAALNHNPSPSAQTAAAQAFKASQSAHNLSSAAAATALRKHSTTPTSIEDVQTKRMLQRQSSNSSIGSGKGSLRRGRDGSLQRSNSSGSMTARTFREQRSDPSGFVRAPEDIIPVPPLPQKYSNEHRRTTSSAPSYRAVGPPEKAQGGHGRNQDGVSRFTRGASPEYGPSMSKTKRAEPERTASRGSINFSYPMNARPNSPRQSSIHSFKADVSPEQGQTTDTVSYEDIGNDHPTHSAVNEANQRSPGEELETSRSPSLLSRTSPETYVDDVVDPPKSQDTLSRLDVKGIGHTGDIPDETVSKLERTQRDTPDRAVTSPPYTDLIAQSPDNSPGIHRTLDPRQSLPSEIRIPKRRPSTVHEEQEAEDESRLENSRESNHISTPWRDTNNGDSVRSADKSTVRTGPYCTSSHPIPQPDTAESDLATTQQRPRDASTAEITKSTEHGREHGREHSLSPSRTTRFSNHLSILHEGGHLHEPPPRSLSPAKSALKHSPSVSPSADRGSHQRKHNEPPSETSEGTSIASDDFSKHGKKRTPKVSFEDEAEVVGFAASPPSSIGSSISTSPQGNAIPKHSWHRDDSDDYNEVMKPRPVLPSFGSIRGRRGLTEETRERKHDSVSPPERAPLDHKATQFGASSDHAIGGILVNSQHKQLDTSNASLPLPPEVTSVEGTGYGSVSDQSSSSDDMANPEEFQPPFGQPFARETSSRSEHASENSPAGKTVGPAEHVPAISVQPATPALDEEGEASGWGYLPGKFPSQVSLPANQDKSAKGDGTLDEQPAVEQIKEVPSDVHHNDSESDSGESIYSDAAEDWSDMEGDGFGSINAIVESPVSRVNRTSVQHEKSKPMKEDQAATASQTYPFSTTGSSTPKAGSTPHTASTDRGRALGQRYQFHAHGVQQDLEPQVKWPITEDVNTDSKPSVSEHNVPKATPSSISENSHNTSQNTLKHAGGQNGSIRQRDTKHAQVDAAPRVTSSPPRQTRQMVPAAPNRAPSKGYAGHTETANNLVRTASNGSDSSSSFKRERSRPRHTGIHTMRRTMRSDDEAERPFSADGRPGTAGGTTSPEAQRRPFSSEGDSTMRMTLRGGTQAKSSSFSALRKPNKASNISGRYPLVGSKFKSRFDDSSDEDSKITKPFRSRFDDSSDDEPDNMKLRPVRGIPRRASQIDGDSTELEDSSDGEVKPNVVRKSGGNRSQSVQESAAKTAVSTANNAGSVKQIHPATHNSTGQARTELEDFLPQYPKKPKKRLFGRLSSSKRKSGDDRKIRKSEIDSAARRDTPLERSWGELQVSKNAKLPADGNHAPQQQENFVTTISGPNNNGANTSSPPPSRLQKKSGMSRISDRLGSGSWPRRSHAAPPSGEPVLGTTIPEVDEKSAQQAPTEPIRPNTSHGPGENGKPTGRLAHDTLSPKGSFDESSAWLSRFRPRMRPRRGTGSTAEEGSVVSAQSGGSTAVGTAALGRGKTKKFPLLRRAFGASK